MGREEKETEQVVSLSYAMRKAFRVRNLLCMMIRGPKTCLARWWSSRSQTLNTKGQDLLICLRSSIAIVMVTTHELQHSPITMQKKTVRLGRRGKRGAWRRVAGPES